jgi:DNA-binding NarL/FixJ family response regulator
MRDGYLRGSRSLPATARQMGVLAAYVAARGSISDAAEPGETGRPKKASRGAGQLGLSPTPRQLEVLLARCETGSRKGAARLLGIQTKTVHWHFARLFDRCGCVDEAMAAYRHSDELERVRAARGRGTIWRVFLPPPTITGTMER